MILPFPPLPIYFFKKSTDISKNSDASTNSNHDFARFQCFRAGIFLSAGSHSKRKGIAHLARPREALGWHRKNSPAWIADNYV
jgi:hypothetical protein